MNHALHRCEAFSPLPQPPYHPKGGRIGISIMSSSIPEMFGIVGRPRLRCIGVGLGPPGSLEGSGAGPPNLLLSTNSLVVETVARLPCGLSSYRAVYWRCPSLRFPPISADLVPEQDPQIVIVACLVSLGSTIVLLFSMLRDWAIAAAVQRRTVLPSRLA